MPVFTIPYNRTLIDQLKNGTGNGTQPLPHNVPLPVGTGLPHIINATAPNNIVPFLNTTLLPTPTKTLGPLFTNGTHPTGTSHALGLSTAVPTISGLPLGITNLTSNATAQAYPHPSAHHNPSLDGPNKRAPMPPLHPHVPSFLAHQDYAPRVNALAVSAHEWVKRADGDATGPYVEERIGIFLIAFAGFIALLGGVWYIYSTFVRRPRAAAAAAAEAEVRVSVDQGWIVTEKSTSAPGGGRRWYNRFGFRRWDKPVPYAGHVGSFHNANAVEEGGLRAAMGGNWNSDGGSESWETQRTAPPAYPEVAHCGGEKSDGG